MIVWTRQHSSFYTICRAQVVGKQVVKTTKVLCHPQPHACLARWKNFSLSCPSHDTSDITKKTRRVRHLPSWSAHVYLYCHFIGRAHPTILHGQLGWLGEELSQESCPNLVVDRYLGRTGSQNWRCWLAPYQPGRPPSCFLVFCKFVLHTMLPNAPFIHFNNKIHIPLPYWITLIGPNS